MLRGGGGVRGRARVSVQSSSVFQCAVQRRRLAVQQQQCPRAVSGHHPTTTPAPYSHVVLQPAAQRARAVCGLVAGRHRVLQRRLRHRQADVLGRQPLVELTSLRGGVGVDGVCERVGCAQRSAGSGRHAGCSRGGRRTRAAAFLLKPARPLQSTPTHHEARDAQQLVACQGVEAHDVVQAVEELWREVALHSRQRRLLAGCGLGCAGARGGASGGGRLKALSIGNPRRQCSRSGASQRPAVHNPHAPAHLPC